MPLTESAVDDNPHHPPQSGRWTKEEHMAFLAGLKLYGREWKKVAQKIKTRTSAQIRSHAQKYFAKLSKERNGGDGFDNEFKGGANDKWLIQSVEMTLRALYERRRVLLLRASQGGDLSAEGRARRESESGDNRDALQMIQTLGGSETSEAMEGGSSQWSPPDEENTRDRDEVDTDGPRYRSLDSERTPASDRQAASSPLTQMTSGGCPAASSPSSDSSSPPSTATGQSSSSQTSRKRSMSLSIDSLEANELVALQVLCGGGARSPGDSASEAGPSAKIWSKEPGLSTSSFSAMDVASFCASATSLDGLVATQSYHSMPAHTSAAAPISLAGSRDDMEQECQEYYNTKPLGEAEVGVGPGSPRSPFESKHMAEPSSKRVKLMA